MKFIEYLSEEYYKRYSEDFEIFVNPTKAELLKNFGKGHSVRWISNYKKKLIYVWDAEILHPWVMDKFGELAMNCLVRGIALIKPSGDLVIDDPVDGITTKPGIDKPVYKNVLDYLQPYFDEDIVKTIYNSYDRDVKEHGINWLKQWWK